MSFESRAVQLSPADCDESCFDLSPGAHIELRVADTGIGIAPDDINRIFEPFFTTKEQGKGTGLGLAAAYGAVVQHKGAITVQSTQEEGTTFNILLPLTQQPTETPERMEQPILGKGTILLVDDEETMRDTGKELLTDFGYTVILASDGKEAIDIFQSRCGEIDLVICDMLMPHMNGRDCFLELKRIQPDIRIIIASGFTAEKEIDELTNAGLIGFIPKPYHSAELSRMVAEALGQDTAAKGNIGHGTTCSTPE